MHLEVCSHIADHSTNVPGEGHPQGQVVSGDISAIHAEKQPEGDNHALRKVHGVKNTKIGEEVTSARGKRKSISPNGKEKNGK